MIQVRNNIFETNSSSADVMCIPKDSNIRVPKRFIFMDDDTSLRPSEKVMYSLVGNDGWRMSEETVEQIVNFLYLAGVEEIIYGGRCNPMFERAVKKYKKNPVDMGIPRGWTKEALMGALFDDSTECDHYYDGEERPNWVRDENGCFDGEVDEDNQYWYVVF